MSLDEGWWWPWASYRVHYMRNSVSLCGHWKARTLLFGQNEAQGLKDRCHQCQRALAREAAAREQRVITYCAVCQRELPANRVAFDTCSERCHRAQLQLIQEDCRAQGQR